MAAKVVANSATGTMGTKALKKSRFEKMETAYGRIPAAAYVVGTDTIVINLPAKELIHAKFLFGATSGQTDPTVANTATHAEALELFHGADLSGNVTWNLGAGAVAADINYVIHYIRGTGAYAPGYDLADETVEAAQKRAHGIRISLAPTAA